MPTMRAIAAPRWGGPEVLEPVTVERPEPGPTEILVEVHAAGVNPTDWKSRAGGGRGRWGDPPILGHDVSGVVVACGTGASLFTPGDEVYGMPHFPDQGGGYAEYATGPSRHFARKPAALSHVEAAGLPLVGLTAWQALAEVAQLQPGERVLVHAAAGGLGHVAVQIAKALGAYVIGTASAAKHELLRSLGVDEPIDYRTTDFAAVLSGLDAALVTIPGDTLARSVTVVRDGGTVVSIVGEPDAETAADAAARDIRAGFTLVEPDRHGLLAVSELVEAGKLRPVIAEVLPLAEAARAHRIGEEGRTTGKLILQVR